MLVYFDSFLLSSLDFPNVSELITFSDDLYVSFMTFYFNILYKDISDQILK